MKAKYSSQMYNAFSRSSCLFDHPQLIIMAESDEPRSAKQPISEVTSRRKQKISKEDEEPLITVIDGFRIIFGLLLLNCLLSYFITGDSYLWNYNPYWIRPKALVAKLVGVHTISFTQQKAKYFLIFTERAYNSH